MARPTPSSSPRPIRGRGRTPRNICREKNIPLLDRFEDALADPRYRRRGAGDAAQPACRAGDGRRRRRQARPCREAADARPAERRGRGRRRQARRHRAGGRLQPALPSVGGRNPQAPRQRPARPGDVDGRHAHHLDRAVHPGRQLACAAGRGAGRRDHRGRRAFDRPHDRVRRPRARRARDHRPLHRRAVRRHHQHHAALQERRDGLAVLLGRDGDDVELHACSAPRASRNSPSRTWRASASCRSRRWRRPDRSPRRRTRSSKARRSTRSTPNWSNSGACIEEKRPYPVAIDQVLHGMAVFDAVVRSGKSGQIEKVE